MVAWIFIGGQIQNGDMGDFFFVAAAVELTVNGQPFNGKPLTPWFSPVEKRRYLRCMIILK